MSSHLIKVKNTKLSNAISELIVEQSLIKYRYFGYFCTLLQFEESIDKETAYVSPRRKFFAFGYNEHFINALKPQEIHYVIYHEIMHIKSQHFLRSYGFTTRIQHSKCNIVQDALINFNINNEYNVNKKNLFKNYCHLITYDSPYETVHLDCLQVKSKIELIESKDIPEDKVVLLAKSKVQLSIMEEILEELKHNPNYDLRSHPSDENPYKNYIIPTNWEQAVSGIHLEPFLEAGFERGENDCNLIFEKLYSFFDEKIRLLQDECDTIGYKVVKKRILNDNSTYKVHVSSHEYYKKIDETKIIEDGNLVKDVRYACNLDLYCLRYLVDNQSGKDQIGEGEKIFQEFDDHDSSDENELSPEEIANRLSDMDRYCQGRGADAGFANGIMKQIVPQKENHLKNIFSAISKLKGGGNIKKTYKKINKKHASSKFIIKGRTTTSKSLNIVCDASGSMDGCIEPILGFCLKDSYVGNLVFCDTVVTEKNIVKITSQNDIRKMKDLFNVYGGTELMPGVNYVKNHYGKENLLILTDGYCDTLDLQGFDKVVIISCGIECHVVNEPRFFKQVVVDPNEIINIANRR